MTAVDSALVEYSLFIGGESVAASSDERIERRSPAGGRLVATYPAGTEADVARAVRAASAALEQWRETTPAQRSTLLHRAAEVLSANENALASTIADEVGKPLAEAIGEVREGVALWRYAASVVRAMHGQS